MKYKAILFIDEDGYRVRFPNIEGCHTWGTTKEEALENAKEVLELCLEEFEKYPESQDMEIIEVEVEEKKAGIERAA